MSLHTLVSRFNQGVQALHVRPVGELQRKQRFERLKLAQDVLRVLLGVDIVLSP